MLGENFAPALGFVNRPGIKDSFVGTGYKWRFTDGFFREISAEVKGNYITDIDGGFSSRFAEVEIIDAETQAGDRFKVSIHYTKEAFDEDFEIVDGVIIPVGTHAATTARFSFRTSEQRMFSANGSFRKGGYYNGNHSRISAGLGFRPSKHFRLSVNYSTNSAKLPGGDFTSKTLSATSSVAFTSEWSWITRLQYNNVSDDGGINMRVRYNPQPGRDLYFVVNHGFRVDEYNKIIGVQTDSVLKVGYTLRF